VRLRPQCQREMDLRLLPMLLLSLLLLGDAVAASSASATTAASSASASASSAAGAFDVAVSVGVAHATTRVSSLTSVTMDVCVAKQRFPFDNPALLGLTKHLGGGGSILRIGGSDQNSFYYNLTSSETQPYSASTGGECCAHPGSCHGCAHDCTMPAPYWKTMIDFAVASGHRFMFGLVPEAEQAASLITHSARAKLPIFAFTFGNEMTAPKVAAGYPGLRKLLDSLYPAENVANKTTANDNISSDAAAAVAAEAAATKPKLAGPDLYAQHSFQYTLEEALAGEDKDVVAHLEGMEKFATSAGSTIDAFSWHTYLSLRSTYFLLFGENIYCRAIQKVSRDECEAI
jgi:hypothetical protein